MAINLIDAAISSFIPKGDAFGLDNHKGRQFRIERSACHVDDYGQVQLQLNILGMEMLGNAGEWTRYGKATPEELHMHAFTLTPEEQTTYGVPVATVTPVTPETVPSVPVVSGGSIEPAKLTKDEHKATMKAWIQGCDANSVDDRKALTTALLYLFARQTTDEQDAHTTSHSNGMGFTGVDAEFLSSVASRCKKYGNPMTTGQFPYVQKKLVKYAGQLMGMFAEQAV